MRGAITPLPKTS